MNYSNQKYSAGAPIKVGDRYYAFDNVRDFWMQIDHAARSIADMFGGNLDVLIHGGVVTEGTTPDRIDVTRAVAICAHDVVVPNSDDLPPTTTTKTIAIRVELPEQTNWLLSAAILDGVTTNYLKLKYNEVDVFTRARAAGSGSYVYEVGQSFTLSCNPSPASAGQVVLAEIVGNGTDPLVITKNIPSGEVVRIPVGVTWMFDGSGWVDNVTIPGFYACVPENAGVGCPNMVDRFVMGKAILSTPATGGSNSIEHTHQFPHTHGTDSKLSTISLAHSHTVNSHGHGWIVSTAGSGYIVLAGTGATTPHHETYNSSGSQVVVSTNFRSQSPYTSRSAPGTSSSLTNYNAAHTHGTTSQSTTTTASSVNDNRPSYYSMIYIRKCA